MWLCDPTRLLIVRALLACANTLGGCDLRAALKVKKPILSYHLALLARHGFVIEKKAGREKYYCLAPDKVRAVKSLLSSLS